MLYAYDRQFFSFLLTHVSSFPDEVHYDGWILDLSRGGGGVLSSFGEFLRESGKEGKRSTADGTFEFLRAIIRGKDTFRIIIIHGGNNLYAR